MKNISVIGAGTMGNGIAHVFAQAGYKVNLIDLNGSQLELAMQTISKNLDRQIAKGTIAEEQKKLPLAISQLLITISEGVNDADLVVEAATENTTLKLEIFRNLMPSHPETRSSQQILLPFPLQRLQQLPKGLHR